MAASDLAQLPDLKAWIGDCVTGDDPVLARLLTEISGSIYAYLGRPSLIPRIITERYDGGGKRRLYLRQYPVLSIASVAINDVSVPAASAPAAGGSWPQSGYLLEPWDGAPPGRIQALDLYGEWIFGQTPSSFARGRQNVVVSYSAGYQVSGETAAVPAGGGTVKPQVPYGPWMSDQGVTYANGAALTAVAAGTPPTQGQYSVTNGAYVFSAADGNAAVLISYGFIPAAINSACIEWAAERFRYRDRIGQTSENIAGTIAWQFSLKGMPDFIKVSLDPYRNVVPI